MGNSLVSRPKHGFPCRRSSSSFLAKVMLSSGRSTIPGRSPSSKSHLLHASNTRKYCNFTIRESLIRMGIAKIEDRFNLDLFSTWRLPLNNDGTSRGTPMGFSPFMKLHV
jgi:hypothetical protein